MENVSWDDCDEVLFHLGLRFPSEAEWEYGSRGGTDTIWATGNDPKSLDGYANLCDQVYYQESQSKPRVYDRWLDDGFKYHAPVGTFRANGFGLHDVYGNLWEWCRDYYHLDYTAAPNDQQPWESVDQAAERVYRGGGFDFPSQYAKVTFRHKKVSHYKSANMGFRPARSLGE